MKLERVNDHQIRCTLTKADLADRQLKLSELAYGTEKAKMLFRDMMQQASYELGFEANNIPLMIEAIPLSSESIILIITKVEDPEELDTRFANFAPSVHSDSESNDSEISELMEQVASEIPDVLDLFKKISREVASKPGLIEAAKEKLAEKGNETAEIIRMFDFDDLSGVVKAAQAISSCYKGRSALYKNMQAEKYVLMISQAEHTSEDFNRICNVLSEYGSLERTKSPQAVWAYLNEHGNCIVAENAIETLIQ